MESDFYGHWCYESPNAKNGRILIHRDSFCSAMAQYVKEAFQFSDMVHQDGFTNDLIEKDKPDYYVFEIVERNLDILLSYSYDYLSCESDFNNYLDKLIENKDQYTVFISASDDASSGLTDQSVKKLQELGIQTDLSDQFRKSFYVVIDSGNNVAEKASSDKIKVKETLKDGTKYKLISSGFDSGSFSSIKINKKEYSKNKRGLNIVVYDNKFHTVIDSVNFDTYNPEIPAER